MAEVMVAVVEDKWLCMLDDKLQKQERATEKQN